MEGLHLGGGGGLKSLNVMKIQNNILTTGSVQHH